MSHRIAFVSATEKEIEPLVAYLRAHAEQHAFQTFQMHGMQIDIIYSGIGILQTTYTLMDYLSHHHPDFWLQAGIGGALDRSLDLGNVYEIESEMISGFGAEDRDGRILDPFALGWSDPDGFPFINGILECPYQSLIGLSKASGMTTFHAHGYEPHITQLRTQPHGQIENMEGAPFFYISLVKKIPFLSIRSISNYVESRDTGKWKINLAISNLNEQIKALLENANFHPDRLFTNAGRTT
jgi:futalosine hydrolase